MIVLGGDLLKDSMTTVGETAAAQAAAYHPDLCFMGVSSRRVIALVDPVKLNTVSRYHVCGIEAFTALITDGSVEGEMALGYRNRGLDFI